MPPVLYRSVLFFIFLLLCRGNSAFAAEGKEKASSDTVLYSKTGTASYYAARFQGRHTSNGEVLDNEAYTCAAGRLPYDTWVRVTNLRNGKWVVVRVTDRFRPGGSHLVDLTLRAARDIDMLSHGIARIRMEVLNPDFVRAFLPKDSISIPLSQPTTRLFVPVQMPDNKVIAKIR